MILNTLLRALGDDFNPENAAKYDPPKPVGESEVVIATLKGLALNALACAIEVKKHANELAAVALEAEAQAMRSQNEDDWSRFEQKQDACSIARIRFSTIRSVLFQELTEEYRLVPGRAYALRKGFKLVQFRELTGTNDIRIESP